MLLLKTVIFVTIEDSDICHFSAVDIEDSDIICYY